MTHEKTNAADDDAWTVAEGELEGRPLLIRYRPKLAGFSGRDQYPMKLTVRWTYGDDGQSGMPDEAQSDTMKDLEDSLVAEFDSDRIGILAFIYTAHGMREWHIYFSDLEELQQARIVRREILKLPDNGFK